MIVATVTEDKIILKGRGDDADFLKNFDNCVFQIKDLGHQTNLRNGYREKVYVLEKIDIPEHNPRPEGLPEPELSTLSVEKEEIKPVITHNVKKHNNK